MLVVTRNAGRRVGYLALVLGFLLAGPGSELRSASSAAAIVDAARGNDLTAVRKLIKERADVNASASDGSSALLWATYRANGEMAKALLAAGALVDAPNRYGVTPLLQASRNGNVELLTILLDAGADATRWHAEGETPLMAAARTGSVGAVRVLLDRGAFVNAQDPVQEQTALMWASAEGHVEVVQALLAAGADANIKAHVSTITTRRNADHPSGGFTALMFAARNGHEPVVRALMKGGADAKLTNADGVTATAIAIVNDRLDLAKEMIDLGADPNDGSLFFAVEMHDATTDLRAQDATRMQPDHANKLTALNLVKALLDLGADPNKSFTGSLHSTSMCCGPQIRSTPFYRAATASDVDVLKLLIEKGAKLEWTPAELANGKGAPGPGAGPGGGGAQSALLAAMKGGGGPPIQGGPGYSRTGPPPYREPGSRDQLEAMQVLLSAGANPNTKGPDGSTPLHQAVQAQRVEMIRALVKAGAKLDVGNKDNLTPLALAEKPAVAPPAAPPATGNASPTMRVKRDSREEVIAALRELMHLGPNDPVPAAAPAPGAPKPAAKGAAATNATTDSKDGQ
jgi:uncharacterized protein